jgi:hypothetical protein
MFDWIKKGLFGKQPEVDPYDQCVIEFIEECKRQGCVPASYDPQARSFHFNDGDAGSRVFRLDNLFANWFPLDPHGRAEEVAHFVRSIDESAKAAAISPDTLPDQLMPGIRARALIGNTLLQHWIAGAPIDATTEIAWLPFEGDLAACVMHDKRLTMAPMARANLAFADLPIDRAMVKALANFRARMPEATFEPVGNGVFACTKFLDHQSALLLLEPGTDYTLPPIEGAPVALLPERNAFYLTGSDNIVGLTTLLDLAQAARQRPHFCSSMMLQWTGGRWSEFHFDPGSANGDRQRNISLDQLNVDYGFQKELLDRYHQLRGLDIFVAPLMIFQKEDDEFFSVAALPSAVIGTLLPVADRLSFVKQVLDPRTGEPKQGASDIVDVAWSEAMEIVGHLFEPVDHLYPPRLRAQGFPDADAWARLKAARAAYLTGPSTASN